jgi:hypothetical protein
MALKMLSRRVAYQRASNQFRAAASKLDNDDDIQ